MNTIETAQAEKLRLTAELEEINPVVTRARSEMLNASNRVLHLTNQFEGAVASPALLQELATARETARTTKTDHDAILKRQSELRLALDRTIASLNALRRAAGEKIERRFATRFDQYHRTYIDHEIDASAS